MLLWDFNKLQLPTKSALDPYVFESSWYPVSLTPEQEDSGVVQVFMVPLQHQGCSEVLKRVRIVPKPGAKVLVNLRCLYALDLISTQSCPVPIPCRTSQNVGMVYPCCNVEQHSKSGPCGPVPTSQPQRPKSSSACRVAVPKEGPVYFATASNTRATFIKSDMPLGAPETIAALESMAGFPATCACGRKHYL